MSVIDLGVHPYSYEPESVGPYIARDVDERLRRKLRDPSWRMVEVEGPRLAGATRTLAEAARQVLGDHLVLAFEDDPEATVESMVDAAAQYRNADGAGVVLWLDGVEGHRFVERCDIRLEDLPEGVRILTTTRVDPRVPGVTADRAELMRGECLTFYVGALSDGERARVRDEAVYFDLHGRMGTDDLLMGRLVVAWDGIRAALTATEEEPRGVDRLALLRAVTDWARIRMPRRLTWTSLEGLHVRYRSDLLTSAEPAPVRPSELVDLIGWAVSASGDRPALVTQHTDDDGGAYYTPHPLLLLLADEVGGDGEGPGWPIGQPVWDRATAAELSKRDMLALGYTALELKAYPRARRILKPLGDAPRPWSLVALGSGLVETGDPLGGELWLRLGLRQGRVEAAAIAAAALAELHLAEGTRSESVRWRQQALESGVPRAVVRARILGWRDGNGRDDAWDADPVSDGLPTLHAKLPFWALIRYGSAGARFRLGLRAIARRRFLRLTRHSDLLIRALSMGSLGTIADQAGEPEESRRWQRMSADLGGLPSLFGMLWIGIMRLNQKEYGAARPMLVEVAESGESRVAPKAMYALGQLARAQGESEEARFWYERCLRTGHVGFAAWAESALGVLAASEDDLDEARRQLRTAVATADSEVRPSVLYNLGTVEARQGRTENARRYFTRVVEAESEEWGPRAMYELAHLENRAGRRDTAVELMEQVAESGARIVAPLAMTFLGADAARREALGAAREWYRRAADSGHADASAESAFLRGLLERDQGEVEAAREWFTRAVASGHDRWAPEAAQLLGRLERGQGDLVTARQWFERAVEMGDPDAYPGRMTDLGDVLKKMGEFDAARVWFMRAVDHDDPVIVAVASLHLAVLERDAGDDDAFEKWLTKAYAAGHEAGDARAIGEAANHLGTLAVRTGDMEAARGWWTRAVVEGDAGNEGMGLFNLGSDAYGQDAWDDARYWWTRAAKSGHPPSAARAARQLGRLAERLGEVEESRTWLARAADSGEEAVAAPSMVELGMLERDQGRVEEARVWLERAVGTGEPGAVEMAQDILREMGGDGGP